jgi:hypothetical protein
MPPVPVLWRRWLFMPSVTRAWRVRLAEKVQNFGKFVTLSAANTTPIATPNTSDAQKPLLTAVIVDYAT